MKIIMTMVVVINVLMTGCSRHLYQSQDHVMPSSRIYHTISVALLPFENLTTHRNAGIIAEQMIMTEFLQRRVFNLVEETEVRHWLILNKINMDKLSDVAYAQKIGVDMGVDAIMIGSVSEYGYQHGLNEEPTVGFNVRLVRVEDAEILWASSHTAVGRDYWGRESMNHTAQLVAKTMVDRLVMDIYTR